MMPKIDQFERQIHTVRQDFLTRGRTVDRQEWQAKRDDRPQTKVFEVHNVVIQTNIPGYVGRLQEEFKPNLPWAEDHFQERVSGRPLNPGEEYKNWPWYEQGVEEHKPEGQFSHTYMERFWPYDAIRRGVRERDGKGIRFNYGDLGGIVKILRQRPYTRQAYLPIYFPEDIVASFQGERVPCTLGYHFQATPGGHEAPVLDIFYPMRSCDYFRYLRDDAYMAGRLLQWVCDKTLMEPGKLTMHIANLHVFNDEVERLRQEHKKEIEGRLSGAY